DPVAPAVVVRFRLDQAAREHTSSGAAVEPADSEADRLAWTLSSAVSQTPTQAAPRNKAAQARTPMMTGAKTRSTIGDMADLLGVPVGSVSPDPQEINRTSAA